MNSTYAPQNGYYPNHYAPAPQLQYAPQPQYAPMPVAQNSGQGMKVAAGALALLAIGIAAFAIVFGMKKEANVETTAAQGSPSTVINLPSEINIPSLGSSTAPAPVVVNNPAPRVITVPGQAPVQSQAPGQQAPAQQAPAQQAPVQTNTDAKSDADAKAKAEANAAAEQKAANAQKAASLRTEAATLHQKAAQQKVDASLLSPDKDAVAKALADAQATDDQATSLEAQAAALEAQ